MAITAAITLTPSSVAGGASAPVTVTCTVSNSGSADETIRTVKPIAKPYGLTAGSVPIGLGDPPVGPGMNLIVPASGTRVLSWGAAVHGPQNRGTVTYSIGAEVTMTDGTVIYATLATLTCTEPTH